MIKKLMTSSLADIFIPDDSNINTKATEILRRYKNLVIEVSRMWKVRTKTVPVVIGTLETIKQELDQNLQLLPGQPSAIELQKVTLMISAHISFVNCWVRFDLLLRSGLNGILPSDN
jgi:hypothetical protein